MYLEVKFAARMDSPACVDLSHKKVSLSMGQPSEKTEKQLENEGDGRQTLVVEALCRSDGSLILFKLKVNLFSTVTDFEMSPDFEVDSSDFELLQK